MAVAEFDYVAEIAKRHLMDAPRDIPVHHKPTGKSIIDPAHVVAECEPALPPQLTRVGYACMSTPFRTTQFTTHASVDEVRNTITLHSMYASRAKAQAWCDAHNVQKYVERMWDEIPPTAQAELQSHARRESRRYAPGPAVLPMCLALVTAEWLCTHQGRKSLYTPIRDLHGGAWVVCTDTWRASIPVAPRRRVWVVMYQPLDPLSSDEPLEDIAPHRVFDGGDKSSVRKCLRVETWDLLSAKYFPTFSDEVRRSIEGAAAAQARADVGGGVEYTPVYTTKVWEAKTILTVQQLQRETAVALDELVVGLGGGMYVTSTTWMGE